MTARRFICQLAVLGACTVVFPACDRDARVQRHQSPPAGQRPDAVQQLPLVPGIPVARAESRNPYEGDNRALEEGRRLYAWMNCSGCHFEGGGGIGPPLYGDQWIYGGEPAQLFDSIAAGRANGMPAYGAKLASEQIWHIVTYVQILGTDEEMRRGWSATGSSERIPELPEGIRRPPQQDNDSGRPPQP
jgi:cytochrome c oxidase cbb3-type subunit III